MLWFRKRIKRLDLETEVARLTKAVGEQNDALEDLLEKIEASNKRNEAEIKALEIQLNKKQEFIERLFASVLDKHMATPAQSSEKKADSNMVDLNAFDTVTQAYIKKKLDEKKGNGSAKKLP